MIAKLKGTNISKAIKILHKDKIKNQEKFLKEIEILQSLVK